MILIDNYELCALKDIDSAQVKFDELNFHNIRAYIWKDVDDDLYVFTSDNIHSEWISDLEADELIKENSELIKIVDIVK